MEITRAKATLNEIFADDFELKGPLNDALHVYYLLRLGQARDLCGKRKNGNK